MKELTLFFFFSLGCAINIIHQNAPDKILFTNTGSVIKTENYKILKYHLNLTKYMESEQIFKNQTIEIIKICENFPYLSNCLAFTEIFQLKYSHENTDNRKRRDIEDSVTQIILQYIFGPSGEKSSNFNQNLNQDMVNALQSDTKFNRNLIYNQSLLFNETFSLQNKLISSISENIGNLTKEILTIKNTTEIINMENKIIKIVQSFTLSMVKNVETLDAISNLLIDPRPTDLLKILNHLDFQQTMVKLNTTISQHHLIANSKNLNVLDILISSIISVKKVNKFLKLKIKIPITGSSWSLNKINPLIFQEGNEYSEITGITDFILTLNRSSYALMSMAELNSCHKLKTDSYLCSFEPIDTQLITCEGSALIDRETGFCRSIKTTKRMKVIQTGERTYYLNNFDYLRMVWGCMGFEKLVEFKASAWIQLDPSCHMRIENKTFMADGDLGDHQLMPMFVDTIPGLVEFESIDPSRTRNLTIKTESFIKQREELDLRIHEQIKGATRKIQQIQLTPGIDIMSVLYCIIAIIILTLVFMICLRCVICT